MVEIQTLLREYKKNINVRISNHFSKDKDLFNAIGSSSEEALQRLEQFSHGGKGVRGGLFLLSAEIFGFKEENISFDIAAVLEILQASLLIHDDIMDNDFVRRGNPSVFAQYIKNGEKIQTTDSLSYGKSMAICVGDIGFFIAMQIAHNALVNHKNRDALLELLHKELIIVGLAQMDDVTFAANKEVPSTEEILNMYLYKTAHYTFSLPLTLGGIIGNQNSDTISQLEKLGEHLGLLFQLKDDELSVYGDEKITGKPVGSDIRENKKTILRALLTQKIGEKIIDPTEYLSLLEQHNIRGEIEKIMREYQTQAETIIEHLPISNEYKKTLLHLTTFVADRNS